MFVFLMLIPNDMLWLYQGRNKTNYNYYGSFKELLSLRLVSAVFPRKQHLNNIDTKRVRRTGSHQRQHSRDRRIMTHPFESRVCWNAHSRNFLFLSFFISLHKIVYKVQRFYVVNICKQKLSTPSEKPSETYCM